MPCWAHPPLFFILAFFFIEAICSTSTMFDQRFRENSSFQEIIYLFLIHRISL